MKRVPILVIAVIAAGWTRIIAAQPPQPHQSGELQILENNTTQPPGMGKDWRRFGSGLEYDHPIVLAVRFGSGLEDDAPEPFPNVFYQPGF